MNATFRMTAREEVTVTTEIDRYRLRHIGSRVWSIKRVEGDLEVSVGHEQGLSAAIGVIVARETETNDPQIEIEGFPDFQPVSNARKIAKNTEV